MLITNKICYLACKLWPLNLIGMVPLCLGGIFSTDLTKAMLCRSPLFLVYVRKEPSFCIKRCLSESQQYNNEYPFCKSMPKRKSAMGSLSHMTKSAKFEICYLEVKSCISYGRHGWPICGQGSLLQAVYRSCSNLQSCCIYLCAVISLRMM